MSVTEFVTEHIAEIYEITNKKKRREFIRENIGAIRLYDESENTLSSFTINELDKMSKKQKNILADILQPDLYTPNIYSNDIVNFINTSLTGNEEGLKNLTSVLKSLKSISEFLRVTPYNDPDTCKRVYEQVITWGFEGDTKNIEVLRSAFNLYLDKNTVDNFLSPNSLVKEDATNYINQKNIIYKESEKKDTILPSVAGLITCSAVGGVYNELATEAVPKMLELLHNVPFHDVLMAAVPVAIGAFAFYKTFQLMNGSMKKFVEKKRSELVVFTEPKNFDNSTQMVSILSQRIFEKPMTDIHFDITNQDNKDYIALCVYMNEKLADPNMKVSAKYKNELRLTDQQETHLNNLDANRIHEIIQVTQPQVRRILMLSHLSLEKESFLKEIANAEVLLKTKNKEGKYFDNVTIQNIPTSLKDKIDHLPKADQQLVSYYLNVFTNKSGKCSKHILGSLENNIDSHDNLLAAMKVKLHDEITNRSEKEIANKELQYVKQVSTWVAGTSEEHLTKNNPKVKELILQTATDMNCVHHKNNIYLQEDFFHKVKNTTVDVLYKIGKLRDQAKKAVGLDISNSLTVR